MLREKELVEVVVSRETGSEERGSGLSGELFGSWHSREAREVGVSLWLR